MNIPSSVRLTHYEKKISASLLNSTSVKTKWEDIAGLDCIIEELKETVFLPIKNQKLIANSTLLRSPKGVLLHGPPGKRQ